LVADDLFATGFYENVNRSGKWGELVGWVGERLPEEDALGAGPFFRETLGSLEDCRGVGEEAAVPEVRAAAFEDMNEVGGAGDGFVGAGALEVEGQGAASLVLAVDGDEIVRVDLGGDGFGQLGGGEDGGKGLEPYVRGEQEAEGSGGEGEIGGVGLRASAQEEGGEGAEEEAEGGEGERESEEAEGTGIEVEEVAHAEGVVGGVLGEEGGEVGVGGRHVGAEKDG